MKKYKTLTIYFVIMIIFLVSWFEHLHRNSVPLIENVQGILSMTNEYSGFNYFIQHITLYLFCEKVLLLQLMPRTDNQVLTRSTRWKHWFKIIYSVLLSAFVYAIFFHIVHICMLLTRANWEMLNRLRLFIVLPINFTMMCVTYLFWGSIFLVIYSITLRREISVVLTIVVAITLFLLDRHVGIIEIPYPIFNLFYTTGIEILEVTSVFLQRIACVLILIFLSGCIFEKKDLLNG